MNYAITKTIGVNNQQLIHAVVERDFESVLPMYKATYQILTLTDMNFALDLLSIVDVDTFEPVSITPEERYATSLACAEKINEDLAWYE